MLDFIKRWNDRRKWEESVLGQALAQHTKKFFFGGTMLNGLPQEQKDRLISQFYEQVATVARSPNSFLDLRKALVEWVLHYGRFEVLSLTEAEKRDSFYWENPYISGELHQHIRMAATKDEYLARALWGDPERTDDDLVDIANTQSTIALYFANGFNMVRLESGDKTERDWYKPLIEALLIWKEDEVRSSIGLPSLLPEDKYAVFYSGFYNQVLAGEPDPYFSWSRIVPDYHLWSG